MFGMLPVCWNIGVGFCFVNKDDSPVVFRWSSICLICPIMELLFEDLSLDDPTFLL